MLKQQQNKFYRFTKRHDTVSLTIIGTQRGNIRRLWHYIEQQKLCKIVYKMIANIPKDKCYHLQNFKFE